MKTTCPSRTITSFIAFLILAALMCPTTARAEEFSLADLFAASDDFLIYDVDFTQSPLGPDEPEKIRIELDPRAVPNTPIDIAKEDIASGTQTMEIRLLRIVGCRKGVVFSLQVNVLVQPTATHDDVLAEIKRRFRKYTAQDLIEIQSCRPATTRITV